MFMFNFSFHYHSSDDRRLGRIIDSCDLADKF